MKWLNCLKIGLRLTVAFLIVVSGAGAIDFIGIFSMSRIASLSGAASATQAGSRALGEASASLMRLDGAEKDLLLASTPEEKERYRTAMVQVAASVDEAVNRVRPALASEEDKALLAKFDEAWRERRGVAERIAAMTGRETPVLQHAAEELALGAGQQKSDAVEQALNQLAAVNEGSGQAATEKAQETYRISRLLMLFLTMSGMMTGVVLGWLCARSITRPLGELSQIARHIAAGEVNQEVGYCARDEVGSLADSFRAMVTDIKALVEDAGLLANAAAEGKLSTRADVSRHQGDYAKIVENINRTFDAVADPLKLVMQNTTALASSSEELAAVSQQMAGNAEETATQADVVSAASEQISRNVASVASASEQMQASIREIAKDAGESARVARNAVSVTQSANQAVSKLGESSQEIGNVIKVITTIAQQTNLLALNATIEAARAGEAGKGFAVVANEVKELANQTARATEEIGRKIESIQVDTRGAVSAIEEIGTVINQVNDISNSIASAVEEQTVTTNEIGRSVGEAAKGVENIAHNIGGVAAAAKDTTEGANDTQKASQELSRMAAQLQMAIARFAL